MLFIRDQAADWCHHDFVEAAQEAKPAVLRKGIDLQLDWFAVWRGV